MAWLDAPPSAGARAALVGCAVGSIAGVSISLLILPNFYKNHDPQSQDLVWPMLTLGSICSAVGAAGGLAFGIGLGGRGRWMKSLVGGLVGAALATVVYELVGAIAFPADKTDLPISEYPCDPGDAPRPGRGPGGGRVGPGPGPVIQEAGRRFARVVRPEIDEAGLVERSRRGRPVDRTIGRHLAQ